jgi:uncharacterized protein (TIGR00369 family)
MTNASPRASKSPVAELLGQEFIAERPEEIEIAFHPDARMLNPHGTVQGGIVAAMLDETMAPALFLLAGRKYIASSLDLNVSFIRPVKPGRVIAKGRVVRCGQSIAFLEAELSDERGELLARATSTAIPLSL